MAFPEIMAFFTYDHLPETLQAVSEPFCVLAEELVESLPPSEQRAVTLQKLLEAKDAAVRAAIMMDKETNSE